MESLLHLPLEILEHIASAIRPSLRSLSIFAQACRTLYSISTPVLYKSVVFRSLESARHFSDTISHSPNLIPLVRELQIHYHDLDEDSSDSPEDVEPTLVKLVHLQSLVVRTNWFDYQKAIKTRLINNPSEAFPALRSCEFYLFYLMRKPNTISLVLTTAGNLSNDYDEPYCWVFSPYQALLTHTGLQTLAISGANVQLEWNHHPSNTRYTQLRELRLLNCDISSGGLAELLRHPRSLKYLTLKGQAKDVIDLPTARDSDRSGYIDAIKTHCSSLETLDLDLYEEWGDPIDLSDFQSLKKLTTAPRMLIGDDTIVGGCRTKTAPAACWRGLLPPNLEHLTFRSDEAVFPIREMYELVSSGGLRLASFTCQMLQDTPDELVDRSPQDLVSERCPNGKSYYEGFRELGVRFSVVEVSEIQPLPEGEACPCDCWTYMHRFEHDEVW